MLLIPNLGTTGSNPVGRTNPFRPLCHCDHATLRDGVACILGCLGTRGNAISIAWRATISVKNFKGFIRRFRFIHTNRPASGFRRKCLTFFSKKSNCGCLFFKILDLILLKQISKFSVNFLHNRLILFSEK